MFTIQIASLHIEIRLRNEEMKEKRLAKLIKTNEIEKDIEVQRLKHLLPAIIL